MSSPWFDKQASTNEQRTSTPLVPALQFSPIKAAAFLMKRSSVQITPPPQVGIEKQINGKGDVAVPPIKLSGPPKKVAIPPTLGKKAAITWM